MSLESDIQNFPVISRFWLLASIITTFLLKFNFVTPNDLAWKNFSDVYQNYDYKKFLGAVSQTFPVFPNVPAAAYFESVMAARWVIFLYLIYNFSRKVEHHVFYRKIHYLFFLISQILFIQLVKAQHLNFIKNFNEFSYRSGLLKTLGLKIHPILFTSLKTELVVFADVLILSVICLFCFKYPRYNFEIIPPSVAVRAKYLPFFMIALEAVIFTRYFSGFIAFIGAKIFWVFFYKMC